MPRKAIRTEASIMNELRAIANIWNISIYDAARMDIQDYYEGEDRLEIWAERLSDEEAIKEYIKIKSNY